MKVLDYLAIGACYPPPPSPQGHGHKKEKISAKAVIKLMGDRRALAFVFCSVVMFYFILTVIRLYAGIYKHML